MFDILFSSALVQSFVCGWGVAGKVCMKVKLGFGQEQILMHNLSADVEVLFSRIDIDNRRKGISQKAFVCRSFCIDKGLIHLPESLADDI